MVKYRRMQTEEIARIGEVNRAETVHAEYVTQRTASGLGLEVIRREVSPPVHFPSWSQEGRDSRIENWKPHLEKGGALYGAFAEDALVGFVILGAKKDDRSAEIVALFVDQAHRRLGIAGQLMAWAEQEAIGRGIESLFLYANPTASSVGFYRRAGFEIAGLISKEVVRSLPGDIVMAKKIDRETSRPV